MEENRPNPSLIAQMNDDFRTFKEPSLGRLMVTSGVDALDDNTKFRLMQEVRNFNTFTEENDPHGEHDFGKIELYGQDFFWKIDYYDKSMEYGAEDPTDPTTCTRVLTVMLAMEY